MGAQEPSCQASIRWGPRNSPAWSQSPWETRNCPVWPQVLTWTPGPSASAACRPAPVPAGGALSPRCPSSLSPAGGGSPPGCKPSPAPAGGGAPQSATGGATSPAVASYIRTLLSWPSFCHRWPPSPAAPCPPISTWQRLPPPRTGVIFVKEKLSHH